MPVVFQTEKGCGMSDKPISVGDLVMVVRGHRCVVQRHAGVPTTVQAVHGASKSFTCFYCGCTNIENPQTWVEVDSGLTNCPTSYLIKFSPPSDEMKRETERELENV